MGKVSRLRYRVEQVLLFCFGLSAMYLLTPAPNRRPDITPPPYSQHDHLTVSTGNDMFGSILNEDDLPPPFLSRCVIYLRLILAML